MGDRKKLKTWSIIGIFVTFLLAAGWHYLYSDVAKCGVTAAIAPVNESPWEHAKLLFVPAIIWYVILYFIAGRKFPNYIFSHAAALPVMPAMMLLLFYAYQLVRPESIVIDIIIAFIVLALGQLIAYSLTVSKYRLSGAGYNTAAMAIVLGMLALFTAFTYSPPRWEIFFDSSQMKYGI